jgi:hypothetical protein
MKIIKISSINDILKHIRGRATELNGNEVYAFIENVLSSEESNTNIYEGIKKYITTNNTEGKAKKFLKKILIKFNGLDDYNKKSKTIIEKDIIDEIEKIIRIINKVGSGGHEMTESKKEENKYFFEKLRDNAENSFVEYFYKNFPKEYFENLGNSPLLSFSPTADEITQAKLYLTNQIKRPILTAILKEIGKGIDDLTPGEINQVIQKMNEKDNKVKQNFNSIANEQNLRFVASHYYKMQTLLMRMGIKTNIPQGIIKEIKNLSESVKYLPSQEDPRGEYNLSRSFSYFPISVKRDAKEIFNLIKSLYGGGNKNFYFYLCLALFLDFFGTANKI